MKVQSLRGFNDVLPADAPLWARAHEVFAQVAAAYGYQEMRLPVVEATDLFRRAVGETTDIVEKEMFTFLDNEKTSMTLRPEFTAGVVRAGIERGLLHNQQQRIWCAGPVFRHERPQAGRYRQFHQLDVEAFGLPGPDVDLEVIALSARIFRLLGIRNLTLELNSLGTPAARAAYRAVLVAYLESHAAQLDADSQRRLQTNPMRVLDSKNPAMREIVAGAPVLTEHLDPESRAHFEALQAGLRELCIAFVINPKLVRGLDYYTRTVFEWTTTELGAQGTVCAGGRYDGLVSLLGGGDVPGIGFALGIERLILLMQAQQVAGSSAAPDAYFCWLDEALAPLAARLAEGLRDAGLAVVLHAGGGALKNQLRRADRSGAAVALILGAQEAAAGKVQVKSLRGAAQAADGVAEAAFADLAALVAQKARA